MDTGGDGASKAEKWYLYDYFGGECDASVCGLTTHKTLLHNAIL